jgi:hypothetical protein
LRSRARTLLVLSDSFSLIVRIVVSWALECECDHLIGPISEHQEPARDGTDHSITVDDIGCGYISAASLPVDVESLCLLSRWLLVTDAKRILLPSLGRPILCAVELLAEINRPPVV